MTVLWLRRLLQPGMLGFAGLIFLYRFGDQMLSSLIGLFITDQKLDLETIALMRGAGSATSVVGAAFGGWLAFSAGRRAAGSGGRTAVPGTSR